MMHKSRPPDQWHTLWLSGREIDYARNDVLIRAGRRLGQVTICPGQFRGSILFHSVRVGLRALPTLMRGEYDLVFVGFYGYLLLPIARLGPARPRLFDAFVSNFDTLSLDREVVRPNSVLGQILLYLDRTICRMADRVLVDTAAHVDYFAQTFNLPAAQLAWLPVGCNEDIFVPRPPPPPASVTQVLYYLTYLPLHGVQTVLEAAHRLQGQPIHFTLIGRGIQYPQAREWAQQLGLTHVTFGDSVPIQQLATQIAQAHICLGGHFGPSAKAGRVIPGKIYQILAMGRPVIAADTPGNRELLVHGESAYLCPPADAPALAQAILALHADPAQREALALRGYDCYQTHCSEAVITARLRQIYQSLG